MLPHSCLTGERRISWILTIEMLSQSGLTGERRTSWILTIACLASVNIDVCLRLEPNGIWFSHINAH